MKRTAMGMGLAGIATVMFMTAAAPKEEAKPAAKEGFPPEKMPLILYEDCKPGFQPPYSPSGRSRGTSKASSAAKQQARNRVPPEAVPISTTVRGRRASISRASCTSSSRYCQGAISLASAENR